LNQLSPEEVAYGADSYDIISTTAIIGNIYAGLQCQIFQFSRSFTQNHQNTDP
jgi:hypothetical protein